MGSNSKHKPRAEQKAKQRKFLVVLSSQVPEEKSWFVFVLTLCLCLCRSCESDHVHTIRFHSVFILFQVMGPLFSTPLRTENNIQTLGKRIRVDVASGFTKHFNCPRSKVHNGLLFFVKTNYEYILLLPF